MRLTQQLVDTVTTPGKYRGDDGLVLYVSRYGVKSWAVRVQHKGKRREYGIGGVGLFTLDEALAIARAYKGAIAAGIDPRTMRYNVIKSALRL